MKDHQGSPRAFVDWSGELIALRDYYAFGKSWQKPNSPATWDLSRFNGKEEQPVGGAGLLDYGARFYHPDLGRWLTQDPMVEKYYSISPYVYCVNNPVRHIDPYGMDVSEADWEALKRFIKILEDRILENKTEIDYLSEAIRSGKYSEKKAKRKEKKIIRLQWQNEDLEDAVFEIWVLKFSNQMYKLVESDPYDSEGRQIGKFTFDFERGVGLIVLPRGSGMGLILHELKHAYQFEVGKLSIANVNADRLRNILYDKTDEIEAYRRGAIFNQRNNIGAPEYRNLYEGPLSTATHPSFIEILKLPESERAVKYEKLSTNYESAFRVGSIWGQTYY